MWWSPSDCHFNNFYPMAYWYRCDIHKWTPSSSYLTTLLNSYCSCCDFHQWPPVFDGYSPTICHSDFRLWPPATALLQLLPLLLRFSPTTAFNGSSLIIATAVAIFTDNRFNSSSPIISLQIAHIRPTVDPAKILVDDHLHLHLHLWQLLLMLLWPTVIVAVLVIFIN